ncbi:MAG: KEOPS complex subunit Cgi121 [Halobacteriota archaeon]
MRIDGDDDLQSLLDSLRRVGTDHDVLVQAFDARYIAGPAHLESALAHAKRSMERGENVADDLAVEVLCYAAGRRQIDRAMELGLATGEQSVIVLIDGERETAAAAAVAELVSAGSVEPSAEHLSDFFGITRAEREATTGTLTDLVLERVALLDVEK